MGDADKKSYPAVVKAVLYPLTDNLPAPQEPLTPEVVPSEQGELEEWIDQVTKLDFRVTNGWLDSLFEKWRMGRMVERAELQANYVNKVTNILQSKGAVERARTDIYAILAEREITPALRVAEIKKVISDLNAQAEQQELANRKQRSEIEYLEATWGHEREKMQEEMRAFKAEVDARIATANKKKRLAEED